MKRLLAGLLVLAATALAGCYTSDKLLLDPARAATPLATGKQTTAGGDDKPETVEISLAPDRWYVVREDGKDQRVLFVPLPSGAAGEERYAFASGENGGFIYGVATRRGGAVQFDLPSCDQPAARAAATAHGVPTPKGTTYSPICKFGSAADLTAALKDYADQADPKKNLTRLPAQ